MRINHRDPYEKEAVEEEREGMNGWGRSRAEGQQDAACDPELPWATNGLHFPSSSPSFHPIFAQYASMCRRSITYTEMEKHTFTELTGDNFVYKETQSARNSEGNEKGGSLKGDY